MLLHGNHPRSRQVIQNLQRQCVSTHVSGNRKDGHIYAPLGLDAQSLLARQAADFTSCVILPGHARSAKMQKVLQVLEPIWTFGLVAGIFVPATVAAILFGMG